MENTNMPLENYLMIAGGVILVILFIISALGTARINTLKKTYTDPNDESVASALRLLNHLRKMNWTDFKANKATTVELVESLVKKLKESLANTPEAKQVPWNKIVIFMNERELNEIVNSQFEIEQLTSNIEMLTKKLPDYSLERYIKHSHYMIYDHKYSQLYRQYEEWIMAIKLFNRACKEVDEAQSAVSSASTMETLDLFSSNKGISLLSTMSNSSASNELDDIKPALQELFSHLKKLELSEKEFSASIKVSDFGDLVSDLFFDFSFDFMSVFSLMKLSSASSDLDSLERSLSPIGVKIQSYANQHDKAQQTYLNSLS